MKTEYRQISIWSIVRIWWSFIEMRARVVALAIESLFIHLNGSQGGSLEFTVFSLRLES
jgi:hypothetical protein